MRTKLVIGTLLLFTLLTVNASALTYTQFGEVSTRSQDFTVGPVGRTDGEMSAVGVSDTKSVVAYADRTKTNFDEMRTGVCSSENFAATGNCFSNRVIHNNQSADSRQNVHAAVASPTVQAICYYDQNLDDLYFDRTDNAGATWTHVAISTANAIDGGPCGIAAGNTNLWMVVNENASTNKFMAYVSTTGGNTGSWTAYVIETANDMEGASLVSVTSTTYVAWYRPTSGTNLRECYTTNTGVTWTCRNIFSTTVYNQVHYDPVIGIYGINCASSSIDFLSTATVGGDYATSTVFSSGNVDGCGVDKNAANARIGIAWIAQQTTSLTQAFYSYSDDVGGTWTTATVANVCSQTGECNTANAADIYQKSDGNALLYYAFRDGSNTGVSGDNDLVRVYSTDPSVAVAGAQATATITGTLQGFAVDGAGDTVIVRSNGGEIRTYSGATLGAAIASDIAAGSTGTTFPGKCNRLDGVVSIGNLVGYVGCDVGGDPTYFVIKTPALQEPGTDDFNGCDYCSQWIPLEGFSEDGGDCLQEIGQVTAFPISYHSERTFGFNRRDVAWAWSDIGAGGSCSGTAGKIGVDMFTNIDDAPDERQSKDTVFAGTTAEQICTGYNGNQFYIGAAGSDANTKAYPFSFTTSGSNLQGSFGTSPIFSSTYGQATSIDCGGSKIIIRKGGLVATLNQTTGNLVSSKTITSDSLTRVATISQRNADGTQWAAWYDNGKVYIASAVNLGTTICSYTPPSGTMKGLEFTDSGNDLFIVTSTTIARFHPGGTCSNGTTTVGDTGSPGSTTSPIPTINATFTPPTFASGNVVGNMVTYASNAWGFDWSWIVAIIIIALTMAGFAKFNKAPLVMGIAGLSGSVIAWKLQVLPSWFILLIAFLIIAIAGFRLFGGEGESETDEG